MSRLILVVLFIGGLLILTPKANAESSVLLGGLSHHFISKDTSNSFHRALVVDYEDFLLGYLKNSYNNDSFILAYNVYRETKKNYSTDVAIGAVRGYDRCYGNRKEGSTQSKILACPILTINVTIETDTMVLPVFSLWGDAVVLTGKIRF